jgi:hypothetical protein
MTGNPASASVLALAGCLACLGILSATEQARAQPADVVDMAGNAASGLFRFNISAEWLGEALDEYSRLTGLAVLIDSGHAQRRANAVAGVYTAADALQKLLMGTGLQARYADARSIVIAAQPAAQLATDDQAAPAPDAVVVAAADIPGVRGDGADYRAYIGSVQQSLRTVLCASPRTRPGPYRLALQLRLDARGAVQRFRLLDTTGDAARDAALSRAVQALEVGAPPPAGMPQPVSILLLPEAPDAHTDCAPAAGGER